MPQTYKLANKRNKINLQSQTGTPVDDGVGGTIASWVTIFSNIWAEITRPSGSDIYLYGRMIEVLTTKIVIRYNNTVRLGWRAVDVKSGRIYNIKYAMDPEGRKRDTVLFCEERL